MLGRLRGVHRLIGWLLYGTGMRILECVRLRVKDVDFSRREILIRDGKGREGPRDDAAAWLAAVAARAVRPGARAARARPRGRLRRRVAARRAGAQVSGRGARMGRGSMCSPRTPGVAIRTPARSAAITSAIGVPAGDEAGRARRGDSPSRRRRTRSVTPSRRTCSSPGYDIRTVQELLGPPRT